MNSPEGPIVLVDMDDVMADFHSGVVRIVADQFPHLHPIANPYTVRDVAFSYPPRQRGLVWSVIAEQRGFYQGLSVVDGAQEALLGIIGAGYEVQVCSSLPPVDSDRIQAEKQSWLTEHFSSVLGNDVVAHFTRDKASIPGAVLIDDRPDIPNAEAALWQHVIFDQLWNKPNNELVGTPFRIKNWRDGKLLVTLKQAVSEAQTRAGILKWGQ